MGCSGCDTGRGNHNNGGVPAGCNNNGSCSAGGCNKLNVFDWLGNMKMPDGQKPFDMVEIRFKNSRKDFFKNVNNLPLNVGDVVAVEATQGHDIGVVSLTGELVKLQMKKLRTKQKGLMDKNSKCHFYIRGSQPESERSKTDRLRIESATIDFKV